MVDYVIADIHGNYKGFKKVMEDSPFNNDKDKLIILGDIVDGGRQTKQCIDLALSFKKILFIKGNHDMWFYLWASDGIEIPAWVHQGGYATMESYDFDRKNIPDSHKEMIENGKYYHISNNNDIFVHGGFNPKVPINKTNVDILVWDRSLIKYAINHKITKYNRIFIGHTSTQFYKSLTPIHFNNLIMCDTGGGWNGRLSLINIETMEFWQSDGVHSNGYT